MIIIAPSSPTRAASVTVTVHYHRDDGDYDKWNVWAWSPDGAAYPFTERDKFGVYAEITIDNPQNNRIGFIVRTDAWEKDTPDGRFIELSSGDEIWVFSEQTDYFYEAPADYESNVREFEDLTIEFNYYRFDGDYKDLSLTVFGEDFDWGTAPFQTGADFGSRAVLPVGTAAGYFSVRYVIWRGDTRFEEGDLSLRKVDERDRLSVWARQGVEAISYKQLDSAPAIVGATIEGIHDIRVSLSVPIPTEKLSFTADGLGTLSPTDFLTDDTIYGKLPEGYARNFTLKTAENIDFSRSYALVCQGFESVAITLGNVFDSEEFAALFAYDGNLGVTYTPAQTTFRLWAPTAAKAEARLYDTGRVVPNRSDAYESVEMNRAENGLWVAEVHDDLNGKFYTYVVWINGEEREAVDPYACAVGVNGMRGQIVDLSATDPKGWDADKRPTLSKPTDAVIYELHVRDLSAQKESGIVNKGKFLGLAETGTAAPNGEKTGLDHILDLGVTHIHLLPSYDYKTVNELYLQDNQFNWGYDPQNYNAPEGSYATNAQDGATRVAEFKQMVQILHTNGLGVVMDVVYNHMYDGESSNFQRLVPGYYFRFKEDGGYSNGSGCGNETASERAMMRKFMIDSVTYWAREYHMDGFRFDLMALHDIDTMNAIRAALDAIDPGILMYGEGWTGGGTTLPADKQSTKAQTAKLDSRITVFSDDIRDGLKGSVFDATDPGYVNGNVAAVMDVKFGVVGSVRHPQVDLRRVSRSDDFWAKDPTQTVTYVSAHDNLTLWDKLSATNPGAPAADLAAQNRLAAAIVLTSQGIPFFQAGEEMARTKYGDENSYQSPDRVNQLDWLRKAEFTGLFDYYKGLIALRKATPAFRLATGDEVRENLAFFDTGVETVIGYTLAAGAGGGDTPLITVILNGNDRDYDVPLPANGWDILVDGQRAGVTPLGTVGGTLAARAKSAYVLFRNDGAAESPTAETQSVEATPVATETPAANALADEVPFVGIAVAAVVVVAATAIGGLLLRRRK